MKKYASIGFSLLFAAGLYAQKSELKSIKRIIDKPAPTTEEYKQLQGLIDSTTPYIGNLSNEEQAEFFYYKGNYELQQAMKTNNIEAFSKAVESFNKIKALEEGQKRKTYSDKTTELVTKLEEEAVKKAITFQDNKKYREASQVFKALYDLNKDAMNLYYSASLAVNIPDYNVALEYYQELLDMNFTGEKEYYVATEKATGEISNFGSGKALMDRLVKDGQYTNPKKMKEESKKPEILKNMVLIYREVNQPSRAEKLLADARKESPKDLDLMLIELDYYLKSNNMVKAEVLMNEAISVAPDNYEVIYTIAHVNLKADKVNEAKSLFERVIKINPQYIDAYISLGELTLRDEQKYVDQMNAITGFSSAELKKYDELKKKRDNMYKESIPHFERALKVEPNNQTAISYLVAIYGALDMTDKYNEYKAKQK